MFGSLGGPELFLILVVALIVFGPRKLPEIGKSLGKMMAEFRKASNDFRRTIEEEVEADKLREATRIDLSPVAATAAAAATAAPEVTPAPASTAAEPVPAAGSEPAPSPEAEPAAAAASATEHAETAPEASSSAVPAHEPALTVSREPVASPQPVEPK
jgi:Tat protein translocase TatB subunit